MCVHQTHMPIRRFRIMLFLYDANGHHLIRRQSHTFNMTAEEEIGCDALTRCIVERNFSEEERQSMRLVVYTQWVTV